MQAKDVDVELLIGVVQGLCRAEELVFPERGYIGRAHLPDIQASMRMHVPNIARGLVAAKITKLVRRGIVHGCVCGRCEGAFYADPAFAAAMHPKRVRVSRRYPRPRVFEVDELW